MNPDYVVIVKKSRKKLFETLLNRYNNKMYDIIKYKLVNFKHAIDFKIYNSLTDPDDKVIFALTFSNVILDYRADKLKMQV